MKHILTLLFTLAGLVGMAQTNQPLPSGAVPFGSTTYLSPLDSTIWLYKERDGVAVNLGSWYKVDSLAIAMRGIIPYYQELPDSYDSVGLVYLDVYNENGYAFFLELGQSNMEGRSGDETNPEYPFDSEIGATSWDESSNDTITLNTLRGGAVSGSHANYFGDELFQLTGKKATMIEAASGGSGLAENSGSGATNNWGATGDLRQNAEDVYEDVSSTLGLQKLTGILWSQGERDAQQMDSEPSYSYNDALTNMRNVIEWMQSKWPGVPIFISELGQAGTGETQGWADMREIQRRMVDEYDRVYMAFTNAKSFPSRDMMLDDLHYNYEGYQEMGEGLAGYIADKLGGVYHWNGNAWDKVGSGASDVSWNNVLDKPIYLGQSGINNAVAITSDVPNTTTAIYNNDINDIENNSITYVGNSAPNRPAGAVSGGWVHTMYTPAGTDAGRQYFYERLGGTWMRNRAGGVWGGWATTLPDNLYYPSDISKVQRGPAITMDANSILQSGAFFLTGDSPNLPVPGSGTALWSMNSVNSSVNVKLAMIPGTIAESPNTDAFFWQSRTGNWFQGASRKWSSENFIGNNLNVADRGMNYAVDLDTIITTGIFSINSTLNGSAGLPPWIPSNEGVALIAISGEGGAVSSQLAISFEETGPGSIGFRNYGNDTWYGWQEISSGVDVIQAKSDLITATGSGIYFQTGGADYELTIPGINSSSGMIEIEFSGFYQNTSGSGRNMLIEFSQDSNTYTKILSVSPTDDPAVNNFSTKINGAITSSGDMRLGYMQFGTVGNLYAESDLTSGIDWAQPVTMKFRVNNKTDYDFNIAPIIVKISAAKSN